MNKEKKQIVVLVSLVAVVGAVGAFQFMKKEPSAKVVAENEVKPEAVESTIVLPVGDPLGGLFVGMLEDRDPFIPQAILIEDPRRTTPIGLPTQRPPDQITGTAGTVQPVDPGGLNGGTGVIQPGNLDIGPSFRLGAVALRGVILGPKPMAVFEGDNGRQTLVAVGGKLPNGAVVLSIGDGKVILKQNGKIKTMEFEEA
ncbi:MAG: hypothetical protein IH945_04125 [Armatimonadetes bacterium]|nr:hypothetical protein [Armatimonadota bacterium]